MTPSEQSATTPIIWRVVQRSVGAVDWLLLGDQDNDSYRISVSLTGPDDIYAQAVYPCRVCGWRNACHGGEDCHS